MHKKLFLTTAFITALTMANANAGNLPMTFGDDKTVADYQASAAVIAGLLAHQNSADIYGNGVTGFNVGTIEIHDGADKIYDSVEKVYKKPGDAYDILNFDKDNKTQHMAMYDVGLPAGVLLLADKLGISNEIIDRGTIGSGFLVAGDKGFVADGTYWNMIDSLLSSNGGKKNDNGDYVGPEDGKNVYAAVTDAVYGAIYNEDTHTLSSGNATFDQLVLGSIFDDKVDTTNPEVVKARLDAFIAETFNKMQAWQLGSGDETVFRSEELAFIDFLSDIFGEDAAGALKANAPLNVNVDKFAMDGGKLTIKNRANVVSKESIETKGGDITVDDATVTNEGTASIANTALTFKGNGVFKNIGEVIFKEGVTDISGDAGSGIKGDGTINLAKGATVNLNSDILATGATVNIENGATLKLGDANVIDVNKVALDGTMIANLVDRGDKAIVTAGTFDGNGKMSLIAKDEGTYKVFGGATFKNTEFDVNSVLYNLDWNKDRTDVTLGMKSVEDIAADNNLSAAASQTVMNLVQADSDKLNDFGMLVQESLANRDAASVEKAHKVINPADASVVQSVATHVQGTVAKLAANRMSLPAFTGRAGGDVDYTSGSVWAQGLFNKSKKNGEFNGYTRGVAAGIDGTLNRVFTIGAGYAFNHSDMDLKSRDTEIDSNTVFLYGQYKPSAWYANATLNYTMSDYTESGSALGVAIDSDYKINAFGGQVMTGYDFANGLTPEAGVRYLHIDGDTYTNSLGIRNKIDDADYLTAILGGKYAKDFAVSRDLSLRPEVRLAAKYDMLSDEYNTAVVMPGVNSYGVRADRLNRFGGEAGLGVTMSYKDVDLSLTYDIEVRKDYTSQTGMVKAKYNF